MTTQLIERPDEQTRDETPAGEGPGGPSLPPVDPAQHAPSRRPWARKLTAVALAFGIAVSSGAAGAYTVTALDGARGADRFPGLPAGGHEDVRHGAHPAVPGRHPDRGHEHGNRDRTVATRPGP